jgi:hypothetical protein
VVGPTVFISQGDDAVHASMRLLFGEWLAGQRLPNRWPAPKQSISGCLIIEDQLIKGGGAVTLGKSAGLSEPRRAAALHWPRDAHGIDAADAGVALDCWCLV